MAWSAIHQLKYLEALKSVVSPDEKEIIRGLNYEIDLCKDAIIEHMKKVLKL